MAAEVAPLPPLRQPSGPSSQTADQLYWRTFKSQLLLPSPQSSPITSITAPLSHSFPSASAPETFTLTTGSRVLLLSTRTRRVTKTITRLSSANDTAHSGALRSDGRIVLAGGDGGLVQAFDANSRAVLKTWRDHGKQAVWATRWNPSDMTGCMSCGDDRSVRTWDLPADEAVGVFHGHTDYVRAGDYLPGSGGKVLISGAYDRTVRVWDARSGTQVMGFGFADPVESVLGLVGGGTVVASAGAKIGVLDLSAARAREVLRNHQKTVTCLGLASGGRRLVSGGLDGHVKVFDTAGWTVVAGFKYPSPVLSVGVIASGPDREDRHLAVGMQSGLLSIRTRLSGQAKTAAREREREMQALVDGRIEAYDAAAKRRQLRQGDRKRLRGRDFTGEGADIVVDGAARGRLRAQTKWESALRKGQWRAALDHVLVPRQGSAPEKQALLTLLTALRHRGALRAALGGRDETSLAPLLRFLTRNVNDPRHVGLLVDVALVALDVYAPLMGGDGRGEEGLDALVGALHRKVRHAVEMAKMAGATGGMLDFVGLEEQG